MPYLRSWEAVAYICQALQQEEAPHDICSTSEMVSGEIWKMQMKGRASPSPAVEAGQAVGPWCVLVASGICIKGSGRQLLEAEALVVASAMVTSTTAPDFPKRTLAL